MWHTCENCGATYVDECMRCKWLLRPHDAAAVQALIGRKVLGLRISDDRSWLVFDTDSGLVVWGAWGGCCSDSWFADITGVDALLGGTVRSASEIRLDNYDLQSGSRDDVEAWPDGNVELLGTVEHPDHFPLEVAPGLWERLPQMEWDPVRPPHQVRD